MGNICDCFGKDSVLPVHSPKPSKVVELKKPTEILYRLNITIWNTQNKELFDIRFNFCSKSQDLDNKLWQIICYTTMKYINKNITPLTGINQSMIYVSKYQLDCLKRELDKINDISINWQNFAKNTFD
jgi:hypothetical protein